MSVAILAAVCLGFARTFLLRPWFPEARVLAAPERFYDLHGALFMTWIALLVLQPSLVAVRRVDVHRKVGWFGAALAAAMVVVGVHGALLAARRPTGFVGIPAPPAAFLLVPLVDIALFAFFAGLAIAYRKNPQAHKRLVLLASLNLLTASIARWPLALLAGGPPVIFLLTDLFLLPIVIRDLVTRRRLHPVTLWGGLLLIVSQPLRLWLSGTDAWLRLAAWLIG